MPGRNLWDNHLQEINSLEGMLEIFKPGIRPEDAREARGVSLPEHSIEDCLKECWTLSHHVWSFHSDQDSPALGAWGLYETGEDKAVIWLLGNLRMNEMNELKFAKVSRRICDYLSRNCYRLLYNYVSTERYTTIHWLRFLGFTLENKLTIFKGHVAPYRLFWRKRNV